MINHNQYNQEFNLESAKSTEKINLICDYCSKKFERQKRHIIFMRGTNSKDSCGDKECTKKRRYETIYGLYGEDCFKVEFLEKAKKTSLKKYGVENPTQLQEVKEKIKKTCLEKYGIEHTRTEEAVSKTKKTCLKKYGDTSASRTKSVKEKYKITCLENYGLEHSMTNESIEKSKKTCQLNYKVDNPAQSKEVQGKIVDTNKKKYGVERPLQNQVVFEKMKKTLKSTHGVDSPLESPQIKEKQQTTCLDRFGFKHPMQNEIIKLKSINSRIKKYGCLNPNLGKSENNLRDKLTKLVCCNLNSNHTILDGKEIDLYNDEFKIGIEYCGLYWHNEKSPQPRFRNYHYEKYKKCLDKGVRLITIFEDEWKTRQDQCFNFLTSVFNKNKYQIYARKCKIAEISNLEAKQFYESYHIQGRPFSFLVNYGLFFGDDLLGVMTLGKHHRNSAEIVLNRLCFKSNYTIVGGSSRLLKHCLNWMKDNNYKSLISWSDNRWSQGNVYKKMGFHLYEELPQDYSYVDIRKPTERLSKQSQKKSNTNCPEGLTESQWAEERGLARIWDCGKKRWKLEI